MSRALAILLLLVGCWWAVRLLDRTPRGRRWMLRGVWALALWNGCSAAGALLGGRWLALAWDVAGVWVCHRWARSLAAVVRDDRALADREALELLHGREAL